MISNFRASKDNAFTQHAKRCQRRNETGGKPAVCNPVFALQSTINLRVGRIRGLQCVKSTGDGYLFTFANPTAAEMAALNAIESCFELLDLINKRNAKLPEECAINLRFAIHFGEVDVVENDREGPHVSYAFRIEGISRGSLAMALNSIPPEHLPLRNYVLCSEEVFGILNRRCNKWTASSLGLLKLKGFSGWREVFLVSPNAESSVSAPSR